MGCVISTRNGLIAAEAPGKTKCFIFQVSLDKL